MMESWNGCSTTLSAGLQKLPHSIVDRLHLYLCILCLMLLKTGAGLLDLVMQDLHGIKFRAVDPLLTLQSSFCAYCWLAKVC